MRLKSDIKKKLTPSEHQIQSAFFSQVKIDPFFKPYQRLIFSIPNAAKRSYALARYMQAEGLTAGVPDVFVAIPKGIYHGLFLEFKAGKNKLSGFQELFIENARRNGYYVLVCYSCEEAIAGLRSYLTMP